MEHIKKTVHGVGWSAASTSARLVIQLCVMVLLARIVTPGDFGLYAMVLVFSNIVFIFRDLGLSAAIIQKKDIDHECLSSVFWINVTFGAIMTLAGFLLAPFIAAFYNEKILIGIVGLVSASFFISSFTSVYVAMLAKEMNFRTLAFVEVISVLLAGIVAVSLAAVGFGVWAFAWQAVALSVVSASLYIFLSKWRPGAIFVWRKAKSLLNFGMNLTGFNLINYVSRNADNLLIGRFFGPVHLGFYDFAYEMLLFPLSNISQVIGRVMFPSLSLINDDKKRVREVYMTAVRFIAAVTFPLTIWLFLTAKEFVAVVFGEKWMRSVFIIQIFSMVSLVQSVMTLNGTIYQSQGRTNLQFRLGSIFAVVFVSGFLIGLKWNIEGVAICYAIATFLILYPCLSIPLGLIGIKFGQFMKDLKKILLSALLMGLIILTTKTALLKIFGAGDLAVLLSSIVAGCAAYILIILKLEKPLAEKFIAVLKQFKKG